MESVWFGTAGAMTLGAFFIHVVAGGRRFVKPFLANDIPDGQKWMAYYVWHAASIAFLFVAAGFLAAATVPGHEDYALTSTLFAASLVGMGFWVCWKGGLSPKNFPAIPLFSVIALVGLVGLLT